MKKNKTNKLVFLVLIVIFLSLMIYAGYNLVMWKRDVNKSNNIKKDILEKVTKDEEGNYSVDFKEFKRQNNDVIAYLSVNNTNIDYVVVKGSDNSYYLRHDFNRDYNRTGWIFADYRNKFDGNDRNIIIYGHNTKDGSMFGSLKNVLTSDWQSNTDNHLIEFVTDSGQYSYQVFSTYMIEAEDYYITTDFNTDSDYQKFLDTLLSRSNYNYGVSVNTEDKIVTLSTCNESGKGRVVLHAKLKL